MLRLKEARESKGYTQQDVADFLKITRAAYTNIENEKRDPDTNTLNKLADYFKVNLDYLLGRTDNPTPIDDMDELWAASLPDGMDYEDLPPEAIEEIKAHREWVKEKYRKK